MSVGLLAFLIGLLMSYFGVGLNSLFILSPLLLLVIIMRRVQPIILILIILMGLAAGIWRGNALMQKLEPYDRLYGSKVVIRVTASEDATYGKTGQLTFDANSIQLVSPSKLELPGRLRVSGMGAPAIYKDDRLEVTGKLHLIRGGRQGVMSFANIIVVERTDSPLNKFRRNFAAAIQTVLPEPAASFALGILIGQRSTMPEAVAANLSAVGLTHIVAVSGYNLTVIVQAVRRGLMKRSKYQTLVAAVALLVLFLLITGLSAPVVRAAVISGLGLWAWYYGRTFNPVLLLLLAAALTAGWNPLYLWSDIGWHLSFQAFFGILIIAPLIIKRLYGQREPKLIAAALLETTAAQIMTAPYIMYVFQQISTVSLLSNVLVVPMVPLAMLASLVAGLAGLFLPLIAGWLAWPATYILTYFLDIAALLAKVPGALKSISLTLTQTLVCYAIILLVTVVMYHRQKPDYVTITDER